jgi:hypothetical protein
VELRGIVIRDMAQIGHFARLPRWAAMAILALTIMLSAYGVAATMTPAPVAPTVTNPMKHDAELYRAVAARVAQGESYYQAAATEQRLRGFPLKPFLTVRPPLLATVTAAVGGPDAMGWGLRLLVFVTLGAMIMCLRAAVSGPVARLSAIALSAMSLFVVAQPDLAVWHEAWAATLIALALALHRSDRWLPSLCIALLAAMLRELAIPFLFVMAFAAGIERRWRETAGWACAIAISFAALALHAHNVGVIVTTADAQSPGWSEAGGWAFVVTMMAKSSVFALCPLWLTALLVPLAVLGWGGWAHPIAMRATLWLGGMMTVFMLFGRADNFYWGMMLGTLLPMGLAFTPLALADLLALRRRSPFS